MALMKSPLRPQVVIIPNRDIREFLQVGSQLSTRKSLIVTLKVTTPSQATVARAHISDLTKRQVRRSRATESGSAVTKLANEKASSTRKQKRDSARSDNPKPADGEHQDQRLIIDLTMEDFSDADEGLSHATTTTIPTIHHAAENLKCTADEYTEPDQDTGSSETSRADIKAEESIGTSDTTPDSPIAVIHNPIFMNETITMLPGTTATTTEPTQLRSIEEVKQSLELRVTEYAKDLMYHLEAIAKIEENKAACTQVLPEVERVVAGRTAIEREFGFLPKEAREQMAQIAERAFWDKNCRLILHIHR